uniref:FH2 domain-containing protein n=1 Tax=Mesocestoides corti TaxID=53468 RepID=A0A5K3F5I8_MESCO
MTTYTCRAYYLDDIDPFDYTKSGFLEPPKPPRFAFLTDVCLRTQLPGLHKILDAPHELENCVLQVYRFGAEQNYFGTYLDMDSTLQEQWDDVKGLSDDDSIAIVLRTKSVVRVQAIINRLYSAKGQELRRALFSLKQIFMNDKDLVHDFVTHSGLTCLVTVGSQSEHTHQNYILRALGQLILYVDGMAGVSEHPETIRWLYSLLTCKFSLVKKTALHLLSVFVGYADTNANIFVETVDDFHKSSKVNGKPWSYIIELLRNESGDVEFCRHTMLLINKVLAAVPDQETFYDITDNLEDQGMKEIADNYLKQPDADPILVEQLLIYEASLIFEDGGSTDKINLEEKSLGGLRRTPRPRRAELVGAPTDAQTSETPGKRRSKRFCSNDGAISNLDERKLHARRITDGLLVDSRRHTAELQRKTVRDLYENLVVNESPVDEEGSEEDMTVVQKCVEKETEPSSDIDENSDEHYVTIYTSKSTNGKHNSGGNHEATDKSHLDDIDHPQIKPRGLVPHALQFSSRLTDLVHKYGASAAAAAELTTETEPRL